MLAVLLAGLLVAMAPSALADNTNVSLEASLVEAPDKGWYASGEIIEISAVLTNHGDAASIIVDPSCDQVLNVWNMDSLIVGMIMKDVVMKHVASINLDVVVKHKMDIVKYHLDLVQYHLNVVVIQMIHLVMQVEMVWFASHGNLDYGYLYKYLEEELVRWRLLHLHILYLKSNLLQV